MSLQNEIDKGGKVDKQFALTTLSLKNSVSVLFLTFIIAVMGVLTYQALPKDSYPEIKQPTIYVGVLYPGNSPVDMENLITRPIEKEINAISEVDHIKSSAVQDYTTIIVEFNPETSVEDALTKVKDAVDKAKPELPSDVEEPNVFELDFSEFPVMNINLSGNFTMEELKVYAEYLEDRFESLNEISKVEIRGLAEKEVKIKVNPYEMEARMVQYSDIENAVRGENLTMSGGNILDNEVRRAIRVVGEYKDPRQLEDVIIKQEKGNIVYLRDVATVEYGYKDRRSFARLEKEPVVMLDVVKRSGQNLLIATEKIYKILDEAKTNRFPPGLNVSITNDQSSFTKEMVSSMENNIISGVIVVVFVLLLFIGTRNAMFVGMAIPMSMFMTFVILGVLGMTINMMVLFALIMALGMLVDNGIVVVENVYRLREQGYSIWNATRLGVGEVAVPIISSTATTLAAFLPLAMWPGLEGEFMKILPITLIVALSSSLFVALVINPVFIARYMKIDGERTINKRRIRRDAFVIGGIGIIFILVPWLVPTAPRMFWLGNLLLLYALLMLLNAFVLTAASVKFQRTLLPWVEDKYNRTINFALRGWNPVFIFTGTFLALIFSFGLMFVFPPKTLYFPENEPKYVNVFIEFPTGTDIEATNAFTKQIEKKVIDIVKPYKQIVESVIANVGEGTGDPNDMSSIGQSDTPHKARITVNFVDFKFRDGVSTEMIMAEVRNGISGYPGVSVTVAKNVDGPPAGKPITIEITGDEITTLVDIAERMKNYINESDILGIEKLKFDIETGKPELIVDLDREKTRRFGLSTFAVADELRTSLFGKEISKYKEGEDDYEIQLRMDDKYRYDLDALLNKSVTFRDQTNGQIHQVPISAVANTRISSSFGNIKRKDLKRIVTLSSNVLSGYNATEINDQIKQELSDFPIPAGYEHKFAGEQEKQAEQMAFLMRSLILAIFVIFLIIVAQFNKLTAPLIIMTSVLFSTIGVLLGLIIFQMDFVVMMTMVGIISLAGIVVNNSIVLIDFIELKRKRHIEETGDHEETMPVIIEAIREAGKTRLRPVLLTAITTVLGLIPLAVGINIDFIKFFTSYDADFYLGGDSVMFWSPLAWTIVFGLIFATFLTLVVVPVMYLLIEKAIFFINRKTGVNLRMSRQCE
jgi:multidrug efflux pump